VRHLLSTRDLDSADYVALSERARCFKDGVGAGQDFAQRCHDAVLATAFCEPSKRTYEALIQAATNLGMQCTGFSTPDGTEFDGGRAGLVDEISELGSRCNILAVRQNLIILDDLRVMSNAPTINCGTVEHVLAAIGYMSTLSARIGALESVETVGFLGITREFYDHVAIMRVLSDFGRRILIDPCENVFGRQDSFFDELERSGVKFELCEYDSFKGQIDVLFVIAGPGSSQKNVRPFCRRDCVELHRECSVFYSMPIKVSEGDLSWTIASSDLGDDDKVQNSRFVDMLTYSTMAAITHLLDVRDT
jgi:aspartate carbamoyltransferase catalytic subunit